METHVQKAFSNHWKGLQIVAVKKNDASWLSNTVRVNPALSNNKVHTFSHHTEGLIIWGEESRSQIFEITGLPSGESRGMETLLGVCVSKSSFPFLLFTHFVRRLMASPWSGLTKRGLYFLWQLGCQLYKYQEGSGASGEKDIFL